MSGNVAPGLPASSSATISQAPESILDKVGEEARRAGVQAATLAGDIADDAQTVSYTHLTLPTILRV